MTSPTLMTTRQEYDAVRIAIQQLSMLDTDGKRRDIVSFNVDGFQCTYSASSQDWLVKREEELARRLSIRNAVKRTVSDFSGSESDEFTPVTP